MSGRKRGVDIVEFVPTTSQSSGAPIPTLTHHTHFERRRRPVKSTVTPDIPAEHIVSELTVDAQSDILEDDGLERMEYELQEREIHGLPLDTESGDISIEASRKRRRTQGVCVSFLIHKSNKLILRNTRIILFLSGLNTSTSI